MRLRDIKDIDREDVSDFMWKWRCKILPNKDASVEEPPEYDSGEEEDGKPAAPSKDPTFGADATIKVMYESRNSDIGHYDWVDYPPKQLSKSAARAQDRVAIKVFKIKDREKPCIAGRYPLKFHKIEVQNPLLVAALEPILKKESVKLDINETASFEYPFRPLWFCQEDLRTLEKTLAEGDGVKGYLRLFLRLLDEMFAEMRIKRRHLQASGLIDFRAAWILFPRGCTVYSYGLNSEVCGKLEDTCYVMDDSGSYLRLKLKILCFNGEEFVWRNKSVSLSKYEGNKLVRDLDFYPIEFHSEAQAIEKRLIARGKKVLAYQGLEYRCYNGIALHSSADRECVEKHNVEGRVLIDVVGYNKFHLAMGSREKTGDSDSSGRRRKRHTTQADEDGNEVKPLRRRLNDAEKEDNIKEMAAREDDFKFMSEIIGGYALKNKLWGKFASNTSPVFLSLTIT